MLTLLQYFRTLSLRQRNHNLTLVYDGFEQLSENPFTHQLFASLKENFNVSLVKTQELAKRDVPALDGQLTLISSVLPSQ